MTLPRAVLLLAFCCATALAQRPHFYWMVEAGGRTEEGNTGFIAGLYGGGEIPIASGFSVGPELGFTAPSTGLFWSTVQGVGSLNGYYHIRHGREPRLDPFVSMGYSALFRDGHTNLFNYGGGVNYWVRPDLAFRGEFRDRTGNGLHLWSFRFGVSFSRLSP